MVPHTDAVAFPRATSSAAAERLTLGLQGYTPVPHCSISMYYEAINILRGVVAGMQHVSCILVFF